MFDVQKLGLGYHPQMASHLPRAALFDVDGTLALRGDRDPYDWSSADFDKPNAPVIATLQALQAAGLSVVYVSGRPEESRALTGSWIAREVGVQGPLFLRADKDFRKDAVIKREIYEHHIADEYDVAMVFDDRDQVVAMWRDELRLTCFQVAPGAF